MRMYRQGDLKIKYVDSMPAGVIPVPDGVLARGEATGHMHRVVGDAVTFRDSVSQRLYVQVMTDATIVHDKHGAVPLVRGIAEITRQRQWTAGEERRVTD